VPVSSRVLGLNVEGGLQVQLPRGTVAGELGLQTNLHELHSAGILFG
jgi:hypothetical protein